MSSKEPADFCAVCRERIDRWREGALSREEASELEGHLAECRECSAQLEMLRQIGDLVRHDAAASHQAAAELPQAYYRSVTARVRERINSAQVRDLSVPIGDLKASGPGEQKDRRPARRQRVAAFRRPLLAMAACLLLVAGISWILRQKGPGEVLDQEKTLAHAAPQEVSAAQRAAGTAQSEQIASAPALSAPVAQHNLEKTEGAAPPPADRQLGASRSSGVHTRQPLTESQAASADSVHAAAGVPASPPFPAAEATATAPTAEAAWFFDNSTAPPATQLPAPPAPSEHAGTAQPETKLPPRAMAAAKDAPRPQLSRRAPGRRATTGAEAAATADATRADELYRQGEAEKQGGRPDEAMRLYQQAVAAAPASAAAARSLLRIAELSESHFGDRAGALEVYRRLLQPPLATHLDSQTARLIRSRIESAPPD